MKKGLIGLMVVIAVLVGGGALLATPTVAQAAYKTKRLKATPKRMRGTWYHYYGKKGGLYKIVIKRHRVSIRMGSGQSMVMPTLTITKSFHKGKRSLYNFNSRTHPGDTASYFSYTQKIKGKRRHVIASPQQDPSLKPIVFTHFKPKHQYFTKLSVQRVWDKTPNSNKRVPPRNRMISWRDPFELMYTQR